LELCMKWGQMDELRYSMNLAFIAYQKQRGKK